MANTNNPHGLMSLGVSLSGGPQAITTFKKLVGLASAIFRNDPVARLADGSISSWGGSTPNITPGTTLYSGVSLNYGAAATATEHHVIISPDAMYEAQSDDTAGLVEADMGLNANLVYAAGSATTKMSQWQIDTSTADVTATLDVHLIDLFQCQGNAYGQYSRIEVVFNKHRMAAAAVGV